MTADDCGCEEAYSHLFEYLDSEMTSADTARIRAHIETCEPCLADLSTEEIIRRLLKRSCIERAPEHLRVQIVQRLRASASDLALNGVEISRVDVSIQTATDQDL